MKKVILFSSLLSCLALVSPIKAQTFVSTEPSNRNVVLEEYTGVNCQYCPDGHKRANQLADANPGRVVVINIHQGSYAATTPDYRTQWGDALANQTGLTGYPVGTVNRHVFTGSAMALNRGQWATYAPQVFNETSCVNVAAQSTIDWNTRQLTVVVEAYYTGNSNSSTNMLNVALLQDKVLGPQVAAQTYYPEMIEPGTTLYNHNHMLRDLLTKQWGDTIAETTQGSFFTKTYVYDIPEKINNVPLYLENLSVVVFIAENKKEIITGAASSINHIYKGASARIHRMEQVYSSSFDCDSVVSARIYIKNNSPETINSYKLKYWVSGVETEDSLYTVSDKNIAPFSFDTILLPIPVQPNTNSTLNFDVFSVNDTVTLPSGLQTLSAKYNTSGSGESITLKLWQDQYGSETTWKLFKSDGTVLQSGGPYSNLSSSGTSLHTVELQGANDGDCLRFAIYDAYGDGINSGTGAGKYELWNNDTKIYSSNGKYGFGESVYLTIIRGLDVDALNNTVVENLQIYPNPVKDKMTITFNSNYANNIAVSLYDVLGKEVMVLDKSLYGKGKHDISINTQQLSNGIYIVKIQTQEGIISKKIIVSK